MLLGRVLCAAWERTEQTGKRETLDRETVYSLVDEFVRKIHIDAEARNAKGEVVVDGESIKKVLEKVLGKSSRLKEADRVALAADLVGAATSAEMKKKLVDQTQRAVAEKRRKNKLVDQTQRAVAEKRRRNKLVEQTSRLFESSGEVSILSLFGLTDPICVWKMAGLLVVPNVVVRLGSWDRAERKLGSCREQWDFSRK